MSEPQQTSKDGDSTQQDANLSQSSTDTAAQLDQRLLEFLGEWCGMDSEAEETAEMLQSKQGEYYQDWLPKELGDALRGRLITPKLMSEYQNMYFENQNELNEFFRHCWSLWFPELPFPLDNQAK